MCAGLLRRFQFNKLSDMTSMKNEELRSMRLWDCVKGAVYWKMVPICVKGGVSSYIGSYLLGFGLAIGAAGASGDPNDHMRNITIVHNIVKWGGILAFGGLTVFCGVRGSRHFSRAYKCHKEINARFDKFVEK